MAAPLANLVNSYGSNATQNGLTNNPISQCDTLGVDTSDTLVTPGYGILNFNCPSGAGAFQPPQTQPNVYAYNYTPTFNLPQYYSGLAITTATTCINYAGLGEVAPTPIASGQRILLYSTQSYLYCATYTSAPSTGGTLPTFSITWTGSITASQTFPSVTTPARTGTFQGCTSTVRDGSTAPSSIAGTIMYDCQGPPPSCGFSGPCPTGPQDFNVSQTAYYIPTFTLPQYYTSLALTGNIGCGRPASHGPPPTVITSGGETFLYGTGSSYYYCVSYDNVPTSGATLSGFTISWGSGPSDFVQSVPSVTVPPIPPPPPTMNGCSTTLLDSSVRPVYGVIEFDCLGGGPYVAFATSSAGYFTPTFTLPQYYTGLSITPVADSVSNCANPSLGYPSPMPITSGSPVYLTNHTDSGGYYYCPTYANVPMNGATLQSFTVSWGAGSTLLTQTVPSVTVPASNDPPVSGSFIFHGVTLTLSGSLAINSGTISGTISVHATNSSTGAVLFSKTYTISNVLVSNNIGMFLLNIPISPYQLSADFTVAQTGGVWTVVAQVTREIDASGNAQVGISDLATIAFSYKTSIGSAGYNPAADLDSNGTVDIADLAIAAFFFGSTVYS